MNQHGLGKGAQSANPKTAVLILKLSFVNYYPNLATITATKASVVLLYMRIFPTEMSRFFRAGCIALLGIFGCYIITFFVTLALACQPLNMIWNPRIKGHCIDGTAVVNASIIINIILDCFVVLAPVPMVWRLNMSRPRRLGVLSIFALGIFVIACAIVRLVLQYRLQSNSRNLQSAYAMLSVWSVVECCVGIIVACMPTMAGPIRQWHRKLRSSVTKASSRKSSGPQKSEEDTELTEVAASPIMLHRGNCEKIWNEPRTVTVPTWAASKRDGKYKTSQPEARQVSTSGTSGSIPIQDDTNRLSRQKSFI